jgi:subtilisin family serine protease
MKKLLIIVIAIVISAIEGFTQTDTSNIYHNWFNKSPITDQIYGAEIDRAYEQILKDKTPSTIIVAVIDGGIDITHEDLKDNIWVNKNEIPDNGTDDDKNGYIDDVHGWNFLGNANGENISYENLEITRIYKQYKEKYSNIEPKTLSDSDKNTFDLFSQARTMYFKNLNDALSYKSKIETFEKTFYNSYDTILSVLGKDTIEVYDLDSLSTDDDTLNFHINYLKNLYMNGFSVDILKGMKDYSAEKVDYHLNLDFSPRDIIGDDQNNLTELYGNNNVYGPEASHGTFVAGIIAAKRDNGIGINGIVQNVQIMPLKVVPNGDERDKDVAKAIRYAVVINKARKKFRV